MSEREAWIKGLIGNLSERMLQSVLEDWDSMIGVPVKVRAARRDDPLAEAGVEEFLDAGAGVIRSCMSIESTHSGAIAFLLGARAVTRYVGELTMLPESARIERAQTGLQDDDLEAFHELGNLACGACNNVARKLQGVLRVSQKVDDLAVCFVPSEEPEPCSDLLPEGPLVLAHFALEFEDGALEPCLFAMPSELANQLDSSLRSVLYRRA